MPYKVKTKLQKLKAKLIKNADKNLESGDGLNIPNEKVLVTELHKALKNSLAKVKAKPIDTSKLL